MLTWDQARKMSAAGIELGGHTVTHPILSRLDRKTQEHEIVSSLERIEAECGKRPAVFAYPNGREGDYAEETVSLLKGAKVMGAFTTEFGTNDRSTDPYRLRRGAPWEVEPAIFALKLSWYRLCS